MIGIIVCTQGCNLRCRYCYEHAGRSGRPVSRLQADSAIRESWELILRYVEAVCSTAHKAGRSAEIILHGGEPLLMSGSTLIELLDALGTFSNAHIQIQSNATLMNTSVADAMKRNGVGIVVSLDGPEPIHDANRVDQGGRGTFRRVIRSVRLLQERGVSVGALATITSRSCDSVDALYDFFNAERLDFSVNRCFPVQTAGGCACDGLDEGAYARFLLQLYDRYDRRSHGDVRIPCFDRCLHDLKSVPGGYLYTPGASPVISVFSAGSSSFKIVLPGVVEAFDDVDTFADRLARVKGSMAAQVCVRYVGALKDCLVRHLCQQQLNDYAAALEVNA